MSKIGLRAPGISLNRAYIRLAQAVGDPAGEGDVDRLTLSPVTRLTQKRPQKRLRTIWRRSGISMPFKLARGSCQKLAASTRSPGNV
jgi:hypothetical protein